MPLIFKPRYPTRNAGFWFVEVSLVLTYGLGALLVIGLLNNNNNRPFDTTGAIIVFVVTLVILAVTTVVVYRLMRIEPVQLVLDDERLLIQNVKGQSVELAHDIPLEKLTFISVTDVAVEGGLFPASFKGLLLRWLPPEGTETQEYVVSSRNITDFDELFDRIFNIVPKEKRGPKTYRP